MTSRPGGVVPSQYRKSGVDIDSKMQAIEGMKKAFGASIDKRVLGGIGGFGGVVRPDFKGMKEPVLVGSCDGVGTKIQLACQVGWHEGVGADIVNHCVNDILVQNARPLFFLDYIAFAKLPRTVLPAVAKGMGRALVENGCAMAGGETAQMPSVYREGDYDLAGFIVGYCDRQNLIVGRDVAPGDLIVGLPSSGFHTNGYSLVRRVVKEKKLKLDKPYAPGSRVLWKDLLEPHRSYLKPVTALQKRLRIKAMAHITGGGYPDNVPRVLPRDCWAQIDASAWTVPPLFRLFVEKSVMDFDEAYRVFNMGMGMLLVVARRDAPVAVALARKEGLDARVIGEVRRGKRRAEVIRG